MILDQLSSSRENAIRLIRSNTCLLPANAYAEGIRAGDRTILSKAITVVESTHAQHHQLAGEIVELCYPFSGKATRIGITGVPGVGKSTFIETFGKHLTARGHRVAVLAIDPSSTVSRGSILGDKTRMEKLAADQDAFIRPTPSSAGLGGVARMTRETMILCEAAGYDYILVETVGVGQSETEVRSMVDFFLLLMLAGAGDELQGIKRGIMEMADAVCITKADSGHEQDALRAMRQYKSALHLMPPSVSGWIPQVMTCSALENKGIPEIHEMINEFMRQAMLSGNLEKARGLQAIEWFRQSLQAGLLRQFYSNPGIADDISKLENEITENRTSPFRAAEVLLLKCLKA